MSQDLQLSPKFANHLSSKGFLKLLIQELKQYHQREWYAFELKDKRIIKQSIAKTYADILGKLSFSGDIEKTEKEFKALKEILLKAIEEDADRIYGSKPKTIADRIVGKIREKNKKVSRNKSIELIDPSEAMLP